MKILHIHQDYPDGRGAVPSMAVKNLISATAKEHQHTVLSINRTSNPFRMSFRRFEAGYSVVYFAVPLPFVYAPLIYLFAILTMRHIVPEKYDLIHAHKLTTEGIWAWVLSQRSGVPFILSIRGGSDVRNINRMRLNRLFRKIALAAKHIFLVSPWAAPIIEDRLNISLKNATKLFNITHFEKTYLLERDPLDALCCVANLDRYQNKGILELIEAVALNKQEGIMIPVDIFGPCSDKNLGKIRGHIEKLGVADLVGLKGALEHRLLMGEMGRYKGFVLPSRNETFGMAYIEALARGLPIAYCANTGVDGLVPPEVGFRLEGRGTDYLAKATASFWIDIETRREAVARYLATNGLEEFNKDNIKKSYLEILRRHG